MTLLHRSLTAVCHNLRIPLCKLLFTLQVIIYDHPTSIPVRDHDQSVLVQLRTSSDDQHIHSTVAGRSSIHRPRTRLRSRDYRPFPNWPSPLPDTSSSQPPQEPNALWKLFNGFCNRKLRVTFCRQAFAVSLETFYINRSQRSSTILTFIPESVSRKHPASVCDLL